MTYDEIHPAMRNAIGAFDVLRRLGFPSEQIHWHQNAGEPPGLEPVGMMFVVLQSPEGEFAIRVGVVDVPYAEWRETWKRVAQALLDQQIPPEDFDRMLQESESFKRSTALALAIEQKGIPVPLLRAAKAGAAS